MRDYREIDFSTTSDFPWLASIGEPFDVPSGYRFVKESSQALELIASDPYEDFQTEMQGDFTEYLHTNHLEDYQSWNDSIVFIKTQLEPQFDQIASVVSDLGFASIVAASVRWDIMHSYQEWVYGDFAIPLYFSTLLPIYEAGHLVCGFQGSFDDFTVLVH